ncbi:hypothetical protein H6P81_020708 [Aristolochia fimbriata]|uniref:CST complex subunit CTC1 n=1 Tax=Aristolochia fimbriata TaxID=158543 RepID=A0AAV7DVC1_ARIFI|nr:hypothetical protein H6P81_020708 [Aristolochia fimbriata]
MQRKSTSLPSIPCKTPRLYCDHQDCPAELLHPPEDCNVNSSLSFTLQICRVEDITVAGLIEGGVIHFHRARTVVVDSSGLISVSGLGCFTNYLQAVPPTIWYRLVAGLNAQLRLVHVNCSYAQRDVGDKAVGKLEKIS